MSRAPSAQLMPTENGLACAIDTQNASIVWPDSVRPLRSVTVTEIITSGRDVGIRDSGFEDLLDRDQRRLGVERVEDRLDQEQIDAAVDQPADLLGVRLAHLVECRRPERRVADVRRNRERPVHRPDRAGDEPRLVGRAGRPLVARAAGQARAFEIELVRERLEPVVGLHNRRAVERVRLDDVAAGFEVLVVDPADDVRTRQHQQIVVALEIAPVILETLAAKVLFSQLLALNHRAHGAIEHENPLRHQDFEPFSKTSFRRLRVFVVASGFVPEARRTVKGSPVLRAPTPTRTSRSPADVSMRLSSASENPEHAVAQLVAHPRLVVGSQIEHEDAPARRGDACRLGDRARRLLRVVERLREHGHVHLIVGDAAVAPVRRASRRRS